VRNATGRGTTRSSGGGADWVDDEDDLHYWCPVCWLVEFAAD
jgi:hypothetical protein